MAVMSLKLLLTASIVLLISTSFSVVYHHITTRFLFHDLSDDVDVVSTDDQFEVIPIVGGVGPESFAFDPNGEGPYTGISDGRIIKWQPHQRRWIDFAVTSPDRNGCLAPGNHDRMEHLCGRPLGLQFDDGTGHLYIADAYMGLLVVGPHGGLATTVATQAEGIPFKFTNSLDIDQSTGVIYFTDSSSIYERRNHISMIFSGDTTGRLIKYDPKTKEIVVLLKNLTFPNGVALSKNGHFLLVAETTNCRILKLWLETSKVGIAEIFAHIPGFPDNIKRNQWGEFWVGIHSTRGKFLEWILSWNGIGNALTRIPLDIFKLGSYVAMVRGQGFAVKLRDDGELLEKLMDLDGRIWKHASEVYEENGYLWIGSVTLPFVVKKNIQN